jgi:5,10-methenyltetrahydrofolate synthetase
MNNHSLDTLRKDFIAKRIALQKDQSSYRYGLEGFSKNILVLLQDIERAALKKPQHIGFYWPIRGEPEITDTLLQWQESKPQRKLALSICKPGEPLAFHEWGASSLLTPGFANIPEPVSAAEIAVDVVLIPCVAWQMREGKIWRLGYGGGFYDRTIQAWENLPHRPYCVGVGFDEAQLTTDQWMPQDHDYPLDALITQSKTLFTSS